MAVCKGLPLFAIVSGTINLLVASVNDAGILLVSTAIASKRQDFPLILVKW